MEKYSSIACPCAFPRFQQLVSIDCGSTGDSFTCFDTEILIDLAKPLFDQAPSELTGECKNEKWICKKWGTIYEYAWSDFSIAIARQKLQVTEQKTKHIGKPIKKPIPLFLGLQGHSYPSKRKMKPVDLETIKKYILEEK